LLPDKIGLCDGACSGKGANDIGGYRDIGGTAVNDEIQRNSAVDEYRHNECTANGF
jgi:hypothetical protein